MNFQSVSPPSSGDLTKRLPISSDARSGGSYYKSGVGRSTTRNSVRGRSIYDRSTVPRSIFSSGSDPIFEQSSYRRSSPRMIEEMERLSPPGEGTGKYLSTGQGMALLKTDTEKIIFARPGSKIKEKMERLEKKIEKLKRVHQNLHLLHELYPEIKKSYERWLFEDPLTVWEKINEYLLEQNIVPNHVIKVLFQQLTE